MKKPHKLAIAATVIGLGFTGAVKPASAALLWNWSYTLNSGLTASGTFSTDGTTPVANTDYLITAITGSRGTDTITELNSTYGFPNQLFRWDGTPTSPIILNFSGFSYNTLSGNAYNAFFLNGSLDLSNFSPQNGEATSVNNPTGYYTGVTQGVVSSSLTPASDSAAVPEPLTTGGIVVAGGIAWLAKKKRSTTDKVKA